MTSGFQQRQGAEDSDPRADSPSDTAHASDEAIKDAAAATPETRATAGAETTTATESDAGEAESEAAGETAADDDKPPPPRRISAPPEPAPQESTRSRSAFAQRAQPRRVQPSDTPPGLAAGLNLDADAQPAAGDHRRGNGGRPGASDDSPSPEDHSGAAGLPGRSWSRWGLKEGREGALSEDSDVQRASAPVGGEPNPPAQRAVGQLQRPPWLPTAAWDELPFELSGSNKRERWLYAGLGVTVVVIIAVAVALVAVGRDTATGTSQAAPHSLASAHNNDRAIPPAWKMNNAGPNPVAETAGDGSPVIAGYQVVPVHRLGAAYDVPRDWRIDPVGTAVWGNAPDALEVTGLAQDGTNYCPNNVRSNAFVATSNDSDLAKAAVDTGAHVARVGWPASPAPRTGPPEPLGSLDGQLHGEFVETDGSTLSTTPGCAETFAVYTFAVPSENGSFVMTVAADTGVPHSVDRETAKRLVASMRPLLMH